MSYRWGQWGQYHSNLHSSLWEFRAWEHKHRAKEKKDGQQDTIKRWRRWKVRLPFFRASGAKRKSKKSKKIGMMIHPPLIPEIRDEDDPSSMGYPFILYQSHSPPDDDNKDPHEASSLLNSGMFNRNQPSGFLGAAHRSLQESPSACSWAITMQQVSWTDDDDDDDDNDDCLWLWWRWLDGSRRGSAAPAIKQKGRVSFSDPEFCFWCISFRAEFRIRVWRRSQRRRRRKGDFSS